MVLWLRLAAGIDWLSERLATVASWLILASCVVSAGNATVRYAIDRSSNAWLEVQWYMFAGIVMLGAPYVLKVNEHVRVDILYGRLAPRTRAWIDLLGFLVFLMPATGLFLWMAWPFFLDSFVTGEMSNNAGGLPRWWVKVVMPVGFAMLFLQGIAEITRRIAYLMGKLEMDTQYERPLQ
jgi:TRAP-type mannitol/chloroaromatic compound transport system permease small subunit